LLADGAVDFYHVLLVGEQDLLHHAFIEEDVEQGVQRVDAEVFQAPFHDFKHLGLHAVFVEREHVGEFEHLLQQLHKLVLTLQITGLVFSFLVRFEQLLYRPYDEQNNPLFAIVFF